MNQHEKINYVEFPAKDLNAIKSFFQQVFDFQFTDYGPEYTAFKQSKDLGAGLEGGFYLADCKSETADGAALIVFYSDALEDTQAKVKSAGGSINKAIFSFPGGRRFHFLDPNGNEWAVWSDQV